MYTSFHKHILPHQSVTIAAIIQLLYASQHVSGFTVPLLSRRDGTVSAQVAQDDVEASEQESSEGLGIGPIAAIAFIVAGVVCTIGLLLYRRRSQARSTHNNQKTKIVAMRNGNVITLQGQMAVLPEDDEFQVGTQQGVIYPSELEVPPRTARPISWYKAREAGVSPLHLQALKRNDPQTSTEDGDTVELHSPYANGSLQTPMVGGGVQIVVEQANTYMPSEMQEMRTAARKRQSVTLETPRDIPTDTLDYNIAVSQGQLSEVEWDSDEDEEATAPPAHGHTMATALPDTIATSGALNPDAQNDMARRDTQRSESPKVLRESAPIDPKDPNVPSHPRLFILTPGRGGIEAIQQPENWSRTTFQLRLLCEGASTDYSEAHLTEEHGIAVRDPNAFLRYTARYIAQTADALISRGDDAFEQAEIFVSSSEAGEYLELLADTLRAWYSDLLVAMEEAVAEGHEVDTELLEALRAQKDDPATAAKQELARFLDRYDPNRWNGGLRRVRVQKSGNAHDVRWLCASCASKVVQS
jgi:hypothetical protein